MKYTVVCNDEPNGFCFRIRNEDGLYCAPNSLSGGYYRRWRMASGAWNFIQNHLEQSDSIWVADPKDKPYVGGKPGAKSMRHVGAHPGTAKIVLAANGI